MIRKIRKIRKRMAKVQKRTYGLRVRSGRSAQFNHLRNSEYSRKISSHLDPGFEQSLFLASLENLSDIGNPVRFNNFAYCMREIISIILAKYSDDEDIKRCAWYKKPQDTEVTRKQRVIYAICGGMTLDYVKNEILEVGDSNENILDETLKVFSKKFSELSKYTHVRSDSTFNINATLCETLSKEVLKLASDIVSLVEQCRSEIQHRVNEQVNEAVAQESLETTLDGLDILSTHGHVNDVEVSGFEVIAIDSEWVRVKGEGNACCTLVWGSGSDFGRGDGATLDQDFQLDFVAHVSINNFDDVQIFEGDIDIDNREWFGE